MLYCQLSLKQNKIMRNLKERRCQNARIAHSLFKKIKNNSNNQASFRKSLWELSNLHFHLFRISQNVPRNIERLKKNNFSKLNALWEL